MIGIHGEYVQVIPRFDGLPCCSDKLDQLSDGPVLGILQFTFNSEVDVSDASQRASILWQKSLRFVSTIPGFQSLYWSSVNDVSPCQQIILLIQWKNVLGWGLFQSSLGFSMMLGYISQASNRCVQLDVPLDIPDSCHLELVSFQFPEALSASQLEKKAGFKTKWENVFPKHADGIVPNSELAHACGEWLQRDTESEDQIFIGLLFWNSTPQFEGHLQLRGGDSQNLTQHIAELIEDAMHVVSACTGQLNHVSDDPLPESTQCQITHHAFHEDVTPIYSANEDQNESGKDKYHGESMSQARRKPRERIAAGPAGAWYMMAHISQHHLPRQINSSEVDIIQMISFRAQRGNTEVQSQLESLRLKLWKLGDCPPLAWGKENENEGDSDKFLLFLELRNTKLPRQECEARLQEYIYEFSVGCGSSIQELSYRRTAGPRNLDSISNADITNFHVSENINDRRSFECAMNNYRQTLIQQVIQGGQTSPWSAFITNCGAWAPDQHPAHKDKDVGTKEFVSVFRCEMEGAREEWYSDFAERSRTQYDLLGHITDWLRTLSTTIENHYVVFEKPDPWMITDMTEKKEREKPIIPPSIFDVPWAPQKVPSLDFQPF
ncbi:hypothetical protein N7489_008107 [Penicillium chrysogenum]|uniref:ABM domain-containing protein n=1 Tax=Penicillium chrysogenum TaxID=5076 RepID=A0ABQ8WA89_PENCH|nr:uncharacterized protein N7489_008107 [Penicillium chrysogenum]KAJ5238016.1 hypothetical protein N7489_008107 [Penicillium chrysogenum]KAJ5261728.1 hypothetical protein N7505_008595 [Penicillium chrysogenum]KAJ5278319.1 hypothetical protein N7524_004472 [Penicillium chrysogenum]